jgi:acyl carrier protein
MMQLEIETIIIAIISQSLLIEVDAIAPGLRLVEDLGADSLNILEIVLDINETFSIELSPLGLSRVRRVEDLCRLVDQATAQT